MRARNKVLTENERADVREYKEETVGLNGPIHFDVTDLPDEAVFSLTAFSMWRVRKELTVTGRQIVESLGVDSWLMKLNNWLSRDTDQ